MDSEPDEPVADRFLDKIRSEDGSLNAYLWKRGSGSESVEFQACRPDRRRQHEFTLDQLDELKEMIDRVRARLMEPEGQARKA